MPNGGITQTPWDRPGGWRGGQGPGYYTPEPLRIPRGARMNPAEATMMRWQQMLPQYGAMARGFAGGIESAIGGGPSWAETAAAPAIHRELAGGVPMGVREGGAARIRGETSRAIGRAGGALGGQGVDPRAASPAQMAAAGAIGPALAGYEAEMEGLGAQARERGLREAGRWGQILAPQQAARMGRRERILGELFGGVGAPQTRRTFGFMGARGRGYAGMPRAGRSYSY